MMNWDILGHEWAVQLLESRLENDRLRHAYLFTGPQGVGRRTLALRFTQAINCPQPVAPGHPCQICKTCTQIAAEKHPDLTIIQSNEPVNVIKVDQIRELQRSLSLTPYQAKYRVALLLRFEEATHSAANALLKLLEEPPTQVVLLLTAESAEALLPTIVSRCEVLHLRPLPLEILHTGLREKWSIPAEEAELLAHISGGRPGYALFLHQSPDALEQRKIWLDDQKHLLKSNRVTRFAYAENIAKNKPGLHAAIQVWMSFWRDVLLRKSSASTPLANPERVVEIDQLATRLQLSIIRGVIDNLDRTQSLLDHNVNTRLATEVLLLDLPRIEQIPKI